MTGLGPLTFLALALAAAEPPAAPTSRSTYVLGAEDRILVRAFELEELGDKPIRVDETGEIRLPLVGTVQAAGRTVRELEAELAERMRRFVKDPQVSIIVSEMRSQPVSVLGAVNAPGVHQLQGRKTLIEILSLAGGLRPDAGHVAKITRRKDWGAIPLPKAASDPSGEYSVAEVSLKELLEARNPLDNISILPHDVITVARADMVYVIGEVRKPGGYILGQRESVSVLQALALAEGLERTAAPQRSKILRTAEVGAERQEILLDLKKILAGRSADVALRSDDILFVPGSTAKRASWRILESALQVGTGIAVYRR